MSGSPHGGKRRALSAGLLPSPRYGEEYFKQLTAAQLVTRIVKGYRRPEWQKTRGTKLLTLGPTRGLRAPYMGWTASMRRLGGRGRDDWRRRQCGLAMRDHQSRQARLSVRSVAGFPFEDLLKATSSNGASRHWRRLLFLERNFRIRLACSHG
jgi:hypothetical protein